jgi:hypothetical protein
MATTRNIIEIFNNMTEWANQTSWYFNFKFSSFEVVSVLEFPYLLSAYCKPVDGEIEAAMQETTDVFAGDAGKDLMIKNGARYFGSILL